MTFKPTSSSGGGGSSGVSSYNTRTGAVTAQASDVEGLFSSSGQVFQGTGSGTGALVLPPGYEIGYDALTTTVNIASTTEATGTTLISAAAHTFDGSPVMCQVFMPQVYVGTATLNPINVSLFEGATQIGRVFGVTAINASPGAPTVPGIGWLRFTPTAGSHTYTVTAYTGNTAGTPRVICGASGTGAFVPGFVRFTKV